MKKLIIIFALILVALPAHAGGLNPPVYGVGNPLEDIISIDSLKITLGTGTSNGLYFELDSKITEFAQDLVYIQPGGSTAWRFSTASMGLSSANKACIDADFPTATMPVFVPKCSDADTGIGHASNGVLTLIADGTQVWNSTSSTMVVNTPGLEYANTFWEDKTISLFSAALGPTAPDLETFINNTLAFAWSDTVASEASHLHVQTPHKKKLVTDLDVHVHGNPGANTNTGNVEAVLECTDLVNLDGTFPNSTVTYNGVAAVDGTAYKNYYIELGTVDGSAATKISALMQCVLTRNVSVSGDLTGDFFFLDVDFHYQIDSPGSKTETAK